MLRKMTVNEVAYLIAVHNQVDLHGWCWFDTSPFAVSMAVWELFGLQFGEA